MAQKLYPLRIPQQDILDREIAFTIDGKNTSMNNVPGCLYMDEPVDFDALKQAIYRVIVNSDAMNFRLTRDESDGNKIKQHVVNFISDTGITEFGTEEEVEIWANERAQTAFKDVLDDGKLYDVAIFSLPNRHGGIHLKAHHLIADGGAFDIFGYYLLVAYMNIKNGNREYEGEQPSYKAYIQKEAEERNN